MKIICVAKNYGERASEEPIWFLKPDTALLRNNDPFYIPDFAHEFIAQTRLMVCITRMARAIEPRFAYRCWDEVGVGIDFTAADVLARCRADGSPQDPARAFDKSTAVSPGMLPKSVLNAVQLSSIDMDIASISRTITLRVGDYLFLRPDGAAKRIAQGDRLVEGIAEEQLLDIRIL